MLLVRKVRKISRMPENCDFAKFVRGAFDSDLYLTRNPDVAAAGVEPVAHWLYHGLPEGRPFSGDYVVHDDFGISASQRDGHRHFAWRDRCLVVKPRIAPPRNVLAEIMRQSQHDPAVLAPGALCLDRLSVRWRTGLDFYGTLSGIPAPPRLVMVLSSLTVDETERYAADLLDALMPPEARKESLIILTESRLPPRLKAGSVGRVWSPFMVQPCSFGRILLCVRQPKIQESSAAF